MLEVSETSFAGKQAADPHGVTDRGVKPDHPDLEIINDRGRQMKAKPVHQLLQDHAMPQMFARPRTPNDNPFIESAFSIVKCFPEYPGRFRDLEKAEGYFIKYFHWYNEEHYHSGINKEVS